MKNKLFIWILISSFLSLTCFLVTNDIICSIIVLVIFIAYLIIFANKKLANFIDVNRRFHECYHFINSFVISLSVRGSLLEAFEGAKMSMSPQFMNVYDGIENMKDDEKLSYLSSYFNFRIYDVFLNIIHMWQEQGGDILSYSYFLINEARLSEEYLLSCESINKRKIIEFVSLWILSLLIIVVLRFALNQFYGKLSNLLIYKVLIVGFYCIILLSLIFLINKITENNLKGNMQNVSKE